MWRTPEIIDLISGRLPQECVDPAVLSNVRALAERLPNIFSSYYLECRLSGEQDQVDFLASIAPPRDEDQMSKIGSAADSMLSGRRRSPTWGTVWRIIRCWASSNRGWCRRMPYVWLEFDHMETRSAPRRSPSICVCVDPAYPRAGLEPDHRGAQDAYLELVAEAATPQADELLSTTARRTMSACFARLPPGGRIIHVSLMLGREPMTLKLYGVVPRERFVEYLRSLEWPGPIDSLQAALRDDFVVPDPAGDVVYFDLAIDGRLLPYSAIASSQLQFGRGSRSEHDRGALLQALEARGLCRSDKRRSIQTWHGESREIHPSRSMWALMSRWVDTKVLVDPRGVSAKAYLGFSPSHSVFGIMR